MIKFLHLLSVIIFCTVQLIEGSIYDELKHYYNSDTNVEYNEEWKIYRKGFENEIASNLRENFGSTAVNIYEPGKPDSYLLARGFELTDGVVTVYFYEMVLRELPQLLRPKLEMDLPNNFVKLESRLGRMFIDTTYYVARNSSSIVYARPEDQKFLSPFSLQQVDSLGKLVIVAEDCLLSGIGISTLSGDSVNLGHSPFRITDCKLMVEISTPNSGAPPVISPYFSPGPKELLEMILSRPVREELETKLQGALYSYINMSVIFEQPTVYRTNQQKLFKSYFGFMTDYITDLNRNTIKQNKAHIKLQDYEVTMNTETAQTKLRCNIALTEVVLYGLDTAYATRAGGPYNDGSTQTAADAIIFSSMQIRGKITHTDANGTSTKEFATELTDVTVILVILIEEDKPKLLQIHFTGWRSLEFSIIPRETSVQDRHDHQSLVYGYILNELPVRVLNHVTSIIGHGPVDGNKEDDGGASGDNGGGNGGGGDNGGESDNGGGDDNGGDNAGEEFKNRNGENDDSPLTKPDNKAKGFFSDDVLDDNFFSDDGLDKNFFDDDLDKNFFNDSKETTPNEGEFKDIDDGSDEKITTVGYDDDVDVPNAPDGEPASGDAGDSIEEDIPADNDEKQENTNLEHDDGDEDVPADDGDSENTNLEPANEDENNPADDDEEPVNEKFIDQNLESDFFSDDFIKKDFFSDDDFGADFESKEQGDNTGNKDQIDNADNGEQVDEDDTNIDGNNEDDAEGNDGDDKEQIDNADSADDVPDDNASNDEQVNQDNNYIDGNNGAFDDDKPFFSDDVLDKDFFSDDVLDKDFFSDESVNGDKKTLKFDELDDFATIEDTEDNKKTPKAEQLDDFATIEDTEDNKKTPKTEQLDDFATIEDTEDNKKTPKADELDDFATIEDTEDNKKTPKADELDDFATIEDTEDNKKTPKADELDDFATIEDTEDNKKTPKADELDDFATIEDTEDNKKTPKTEQLDDFATIEDTEDNKKTPKADELDDFATIEDTEDNKKTPKAEQLDDFATIEDTEDNKKTPKADELDDFATIEDTEDDKKAPKAEQLDDFATIEDTEDDKKTLNKGGKKKPKAEQLDDFATIEDTEDNKKTLNKGGKKKPKAEQLDDFATIEDTEDSKKTLNKGGKKKPKAEQLDDFATIEDTEDNKKTLNKGGKKKPKAEQLDDFATIEDTEDSKKTLNKGGKKKPKAEQLDDFATIEDTEDNKKTLNKGGKKKPKAEQLDDFATIEDTEDNKKTLNNADKKKLKAEFFSSAFFSDMDFELDSAEGSRRRMPQGNNTANERNPKNRDGDRGVVDQRRENLTITIEEKHISKENVTGNVENSREGKKIDLPSNVHNTRRRQNVHTSDNEIR